MMTHLTRALLAAVMLLTILLTACAIEPEAAADTGHAGMATGRNPMAGLAKHNHPMAPLSDMPADVQASPERTQQAYQFAVVNPDMAKEIPCYCGCVGLGHKSTYDCYIAGVEPDGTVTWDSHAVNCTVCVDITYDTMRLMDGGQPAQIIRQYVDHNYADYGPPTPLGG